MSNIDNIISKLKEEAAEKINNIKAESESRSDHERKTIIEVATVEVENIMAKAKLESEQRYDRIISGAELKVRDQRLMEQQKLFDRILDLAKDKLNKSTDSEFAKSIEKALANIKSDDTVTLVVPKERVTGLKNLNLNAKISEDEFTDNGFVINSGRMSYNFKINDLISAKRQELELELAKKLFND